MAAFDTISDILQFKTSVTGRQVNKEYHLLSYFVSFLCQLQIHSRISAVILNTTHYYIEQTFALNPVIWSTVDWIHYWPVPGLL